MQQLFAHDLGEHAGGALRLFARRQKIYAQQRAVIAMYAKHAKGYF